ncbi:zf-met domain-containing protein [Cephalotus follicularis]|uniref:Zf-met domain-containing protein n=1 Tax=Cephalotus follicularis TaxID=3775 RepID=A0A1Q3CNA1_CEPFO|nr:zf-met domain-containing protein [Cephalotus follicularis]
MFPHHQQQPSFTYFSHQAQSTDPNAYLSIPHQALLPDPSLHPPGTDPYANLGRYPLTNVGIGSQAHLYGDPNVGSQSWITSQADPIRYESYDATSLLSKSLDSSINTNLVHQPLVNYVAGGIPMQNNANQSFCCDVCKIDCNSKDVFQTHISGKKHQKNMAATLPQFSNTIKSIGSLGQMGIGQQITFGASGVAASQELEIKKQKLLGGGAAADSVRFCTVCNVACNSQEVFAKHLSGRKHAAQAGLMSLDGIGSYFAAIKAQNNSFWSKGPKKNKFNQSAWCDVCKINCNNNDAYTKHLLGKKHQKNLEKLGKSKNGNIDTALSAAPAVPMIGPVENPKAKENPSVDSQKSQKRSAEPLAPAEDLETKKRKVVEGGAAIGDVRVCTICNVVCNSQTVFNSHLTGQKHAAMLKKAAEATMAAAAKSVNV